MLLPGAAVVDAGVVVGGGGAVVVVVDAGGGVGGGVVEVHDFAGVIAGSDRRARVVDGFLRVVLGMPPAGHGHGDGLVVVAAVGVVDAPNVGLDILEADVE